MKSIFLKWNEFCFVEKSLQQQTNNNYWLIDWLLMWLRTGIELNWSKVIIIKSRLDFHCHHHDVDDKKMQHWKFGQIFWFQKIQNFKTYFLSSSRLKVEEKMSWSEIFCQFTSTWNIEKTNHRLMMHTMPSLSSIMMMIMIFLVVVVFHSAMK